MKKIGVVSVMILAMWVIVVFPCYGEDITAACYQKNNGQLRVLIPPEVSCRPSEVKIPWPPGGTADVPRICAADIYCPIPGQGFPNCSATKKSCDVGTPITILGNDIVFHEITFGEPFDREPVCVLNVVSYRTTPLLDLPFIYKIDYEFTIPQPNPPKYEKMTVYIQGYSVETASWFFDFGEFNFICTEPLT